MLQGCSDADGTTTSTTMPPNLLSTSIQKILEDEKDALINPAIAKAMPDPLPVVVELSNTTDAGLMPGFLCNMTARYSISLDEVDGLKNLHITHFNSAAISKSQWECMTKGCDVAIVADVEDDNVVLNHGVAGVGLSGCKFSTNATGTITAEIDMKATVSMRGTVTPDLNKECIHIALTQTDVNFTQVSVHDTKVNIKMAGIDLDVSNFADQIVNESPELGKDIANAVHTEISKAVTDAVAQLPCIKMGALVQVV